MYFASQEYCTSFKNLVWREKLRNEQSVNTTSREFIFCDLPKTHFLLLFLKLNKIWLFSSVGNFVWKWKRSKHTYFHRLRKWKRSKRTSFQSLRNWKRDKHTYFRSLGKWKRDKQIYFPKFDSRKFPDMETLFGQPFQSSFIIQRQAQAYTRSMFFIKLSWLREEAQGLDLKF